MGELASEDNLSAANAGDTSPEPAVRKADPSAGLNANVGQALRSAYQQTVAEDVPDDLLALLGKLE